ncbi:MAG: diacylglycerol kinase family lipid kinase [Proteobacteria bacterium]|nr:diacylglycerol kinase family lipid kinase [Pseudomonadota bacterium]MCP4918372.1 diacylglycerol kinase family lipid kinase [Pseudomonadota bacterium]
MLESVVVIANPVAGAGGVGKKLAGWQAKLPGVEVRLTQHRGHARELAAQALGEGFDTLISLGGDGTHNEVLNGIIDSGRTDATMGLLSGGTGGDLRRILTHKGTAEGLMSAAHPVDAIRVEWDGQVRHAFNIASVGISAVIDEGVNASSKRLGGTLSFGLATVRALAAYRPPVLSLQLDGEDLGSHKTTVLSVANAPYAGGGMFFAPDAKVDDGQIDVVLVRDATFLQSISDLPRLYKGTHIELDRVVFRRGRVLEVQSVGDEPGLLEMDGEEVGAVPATFTVTPKALRLIDVDPAHLS